MVYDYAEYPDIRNAFNHYWNAVQQQVELGSQGTPQITQELLTEFEALVQQKIAAIAALPVDAQMTLREPNDLKTIKALRPQGQHMVSTSIPKDYQDRLLGALIGRSAGCTLGAIVEFWQVKDMEDWAAKIGDTFPPVDYWSCMKNPDMPRYGFSPNKSYTRGEMDGIPVDDDLVYTQLGLLIAEEHGVNFTTQDVGKTWLKYLPMACTAEHVALENLKKGIPAHLCGETDNLYQHWIGADIRSDPFGYMAPGNPEKAAQMAYQDAYLSHRRNGIYGEMFFAAAISAAFVVDDPVEALRLGLLQIPCDCQLARDIHWALEVGHTVKSYRDAIELVSKRFDRMSGVHTNNNACLTVFGIMLGGRDLTKVIGHTVAMGMDNDCTAATAGSIVGAVIGADHIPPHWSARYNNKMHSYLIDTPLFMIDDLCQRFELQAKKVCANG